MTGWRRFHSTGPIVEKRRLSGFDLGQGCVAAVRAGLRQEREFMARVLSTEIWAAGWALAGGFLLVAAYALANASMGALTSEAAFAGVWCGPAAHAASDATVLLGHCARCWPAFASAALGVGAMVQAWRFAARARSQRG